MDDLISRQDAIDAVEESRRLNHHQDGKAARAHEYEHRHFLKILRDLPSAKPEINKQELIRTMNAGIIATNTKDVYSCGMRNGIRWCRALLEDDPPKFEDASQYAEPEIIHCKNCKHRDSNDCPMYYEEWIEIDEGDGYFDTDNIIHDWTTDEGFCHCAELRGEEE